MLLLSFSSFCFFSTKIIPMRSIYPKIRIYLLDSQASDDGHKIVSKNIASGVSHRKKPPSYI